jgi:hypothetical protein
MSLDINKISQQIRTIPHFSKNAAAMRRHFENVYLNPRKAMSPRFQWDYWQIKNQYRLHRTMAKNFFPKKLYQSFLDELLLYGQEILGCHSVSEPWLSFYTDGCFQNLHTDSPHGPWAYVFSLTPWKKRDFSGGETIILKPEILNFNENEQRLTKNNRQGLEYNDLFYQLPAEFNQLLIFDPSLPHGVNPLEGAYEQLDARIVMHGWFVKPEAFVTGGLTEKEISEPLNQFFNTWSKTIESDWDGISRVRGLFIMSITIKNGSVKDIKIKTDRIRGVDHKEKIQLFEKTNQILKKVSFPKPKYQSKKNKSSQLILPIIF